MAQYDVDLREYWRIIRKRKLIIILMTILAGICSYGFSKFQEPNPLYRATASVKIEQKTNLALVLSGGYWNQAESMATHAYTINSYPVLIKTAKALDWLPADLSEAEIYQKASHTDVIDRLKQMISTSQEEGTNIINITVESKEPRLAARVVNLVVVAYRDFNIRQNNDRTQEMRRFIEKQLAITSAQLEQAEKDVRQFQERHGMLAMNEKSRQVLTQLAEAQGELEQIQDKKGTVKYLLQQFSGDNIEGMPTLTAKQLVLTEQGSPLYGFQGKLEELLLERQSLLSKYTAKHPNVKAVEDQIRMLAQDAKSDLEMLLVSFEKRSSKLAGQIADLREASKELPKEEHQLAKLQREVDLYDNLYTELKKKHQEVLIQESGLTYNVTPVKPAIAPERPFNIPSKLMILFTGLILGLILGVVFAFGAEMFDTSMGTIEDVENSLQVPVIGVIPHLWEEDKGKKGIKRKDSEIAQGRELIAHYDPKSLAAEAFRSLRTNLQFIRLEKKRKSFLITSAFVQEGKTLNAVNLGLSLAQTGEKVLLVEADLRRSLINKIFGLPREPGLTDYVLGNYQWREVVNTISDVMLGDFDIDEILKTPGLDNLHMITAGTKPPNPTEILNSHRFRDFLEEAYQEYSFILIDAPPVLPVADPSEIAPYTDGVILVYTVGRIARGVLKRAKSTLDNIDAKVVGVILNNVKPEVGPDYFKYHTHYYYGPDTPKTNETDGAGKWFNALAKNWDAGSKFSLAILFAALLLLLLGLYLTF